MSRSTEDVVEGLTRDLRPVRPIPPLRRMVAVVLVVGGVAAGIALWILGANAQLLHAAKTYPAFAAIWIGLPLVAGGGVVAALAGAVPGRELEARVAFGVTVAGAFVALVVGGVLGFAGPAPPAPAAPFTALRLCASMAFLLACPAAAVGVGLVLRGAPARPLASLAAAGCGAAALGSFANHMRCVQFDAGHLLMGHVLVPLVAAGLLAVPVWLLSRRLARRRTG